MKIITDLGNSAKNNVLIDLVTEEDSDEVKYKRDTGIVYDGGRQLLGSSLEVKTKIAICQKCIRKKHSSKNHVQKISPTKTFDAFTKFNTTLRGIIMVKSV